MNIEGLKLFKEVASKGSISKVAESSHYSQPAISQQIKRLEETTGYDLLIRSNKGVELTEAGAVVNKYATNIVRSYENMLEDLAIIENNYHIIRINCTSIISTYSLPCTVYSINNNSWASSPVPIRLETYTNRSDEIEANIANDTFDLGIIISKPKLKALQAELISTDALVPVASPKYKLEEPLTAGQLAATDLILPSEKFRIMNGAMNWFSAAGFKEDQLKISTQMDEIEPIKSTVIKGYGVSFLPYLTIKKELYTKQLKKLEVENYDLRYEIYMIYKPSRLEDATFRDFVKMFKKSAKKTFC